MSNQEPHLAAPAAGAQQAASPVDDVSLLDLLLVLAAHLRLLVLLPLVIGVITLGVSFLIPPTFTASTQVLPPQQQSSTAAALLGSLGGVAGALGGTAAGVLKNPTEQWIGLLKSRVIADAIVNRFKLRTLYEVDFQFQARDRLAASTVIASGKDGLVDIKVDDRDPRRAAQLASAYVEELQALTSTLAVTEAAQRRLFFEKQLNEAKEGLVKAETALKEGGIGADVLKTSPTAAVAALAQLQASVAAQEVKLSVMRTSMTENNPEYLQAATLLASLRAQLKAAEQGTPGMGRSDAAKYVARYREFKYYETLFELFARQYEAARADEARNGALVQVVDPAQIPEYKSKPKRAVMAIVATALSFIVCVIFIFLREAMRNYSKRPAGAAKLALLRDSVAWRKTR